MSMVSEILNEIADFHPDGTWWRYKDATGVEREGIFVHFTDFGGTDVTYYFRRADNTLDLVSGSRLKAATRIWGKK
jgi:hypothetical protein